VIDLYNLICISPRPTNTLPIKRDFLFFIYFFIFLCSPLNPFQGVGGFAENDLDHPTTNHFD
jgi:hypothetical protein